MVHIIPRDKVRHLEWKPGQEVPPGPNFNRPSTPPTPSVGSNLDLNFTIDDILKGKTFYDDKLGIALQQAFDYAGTNPIIATMPELITAKLKADENHDFWQEWYSVHTEENIGIDKVGRFYTRNEPVLVIVNGGGILTPNRIKQAYDEELINGSAKYTDKEFDDLLDGKLPDGTPIQLYKFEDIKNGVSSLPHRSGIVMPYSMAQNTESGYHQKKPFLENPLVIARAGGLENLEAYYEKAKHSDGDLGCYHPFDGRDASTPQGRVLFLNNYYSGLDCYNYLVNFGRFVVVAPEAHDAKK
mgnify:CR=1 FL=1